MAYKFIRNKNLIRDAVKLLIGVLLLVLVFYKVDFTNFVSVFRKSDYRYYSFGFLAFCVMGFFESLRIYVALRSYPLSLGQSVRLFLSGTYFSNFMPGTLGSEIYKVYYLHGIERGVNKPITIMLMLRITGLATLVMAAAIYSALNHTHIAGAIRDGSGIWESASGVIWFLVLVSMAIVAGIVVIGAVKGFGAGFARLAAVLSDCIYAVRQISKPQYLYITALSFMVHTARVASFYYFIRAFGESIYILDLIVVTAVVVLASILPISFASLGVREGAIAGSLYIFGITQPCAVAVAVISRAALWVFSLAGGLLFLTTKSSRQKGRGPTG